ncbi:TrmH family RNA methyltransferase [Garicola koreensis]|uniref:TrmH family RNA methyltransferase n=1 Tax=Garicola koreensis TaxID=1262554 RepID=A0A7W5TTW5_9MICC|nr:RNA methyltransferase [Garicola koreensis]MBB3667698.1 TrmH family RNA methyltransferase [Garicola koreensis]
MTLVTEHVMDNPRAERVKKTALLATRSGRRKQGLFLAEGPQPVREAMRLWLQQWEAGESAGAPSPFTPTLDALYFDPAALEQHSDVQALLDRMRGVLFDPQTQLPRGGRVFLREATAEVLSAMGDAETSQGIIAVCRIPRLEFEGLDSLLMGTSVGDGSFTAQHPPLTLAPVITELQDPGNVGTIIRTADAAGAGVVILSPGSADPWAPKVVRAAAGSHFHIPIAAGIDLRQLIDLTRANGWQVLAAAGGGDTSLIAMTSHQPARPTLWLLGNEAHGLSDEQLQLADHRVAVPMYGQAESLNVAVAAGICLYASAMHQRRAAQ